MEHKEETRAYFGELLAANGYRDDDGALSRRLLMLYDAASVELLRVEVSANDIIAQAGSNQVTHDRALAFTLVFLYAPRSFDHFTVLLNATDANGNNLDTALIRADFRYVPDPELQ